MFLAHASEGMLFANPDFGHAIALQEDRSLLLCRQRKRDTGRPNRVQYYPDYDSLGHRNHALASEQIVSKQSVLYELR